MPIVEHNIAEIGSRRTNSQIHRKLQVETESPILNGHDSLILNEFCEKLLQAYHRNRKINLHIRMIEQISIFAKFSHTQYVIYMGVVI